MSSSVPATFHYPVLGIILIVISYLVSLSLTYFLFKGKDDTSNLRNAFLLQLVWWVANIGAYFIPFIGLLGWVWVAIFFMVWKASSKEQVGWAKYAFACYFINLFITILEFFVVGSAVFKSMRI